MLSCTDKVFVLLKRESGNAWPLRAFQIRTCSSPCWILGRPQERGAARIEQRLGRRVYGLLSVKDRRRRSLRQANEPEQPPEDPGNDGHGDGRHDGAAKALDLQARQELVADEQDDRSTDQGSDCPQEADTDGDADK